MKRRRRSSCQNWKSGEIPKIGEEDDTVIWSRFGTDLPAEIFTDIVLRLPIKSILACKCVCKTWRQRTSDPEFAELHFKRAQQSVILRSTEPSHVCRTLYLLEPQHYRFDDTCHDESSSEEQAGTILDTKLKIPLRDHKLTLDGRLDSLAKANSKGRVKGKRLIATRPREDRYCVVNSCNGLLCLSEPKGNNPVAVCNPVTGECSQLMGSSNFVKESLPIIVGLGFCPSTSQYKAVRICSKYVEVPGKRELQFDQMVAEVQTLGSGSWKEVTIGYAPKYYNCLQYPTYARGKVQWLSAEGVDSDEVFLFNMENDQFGSVALPISDPKRKWGPNLTTMGFLHNQICICHICYYSNQIPIWLMSDNGTTNTWEMVFSVDRGTDTWPYHGLYYPMKLYENGAVLIFHTSGGLVYHDPNGCEFKYFRVQGSNPKFVATAYVPSFISLEKQIIGDDAVVQNVILRCAQFKLREEELEVYMRNDGIYDVVDSDNPAFYIGYGLDFASESD